MNIKKLEELVTELRIVVEEFIEQYPAAIVDQLSNKHVPEKGVPGCHAGWWNLVFKEKDYDFMNVGLRLAKELGYKDRLSLSYALEGYWDRLVWGLWCSRTVFENMKPMTMVEQWERVLERVKNDK